MSEMESAKEGIQVISELMKAAGDNPDVRQAAANLGKTALTLTKTINTCLLPLAAVNYAVERARDYFTKTFPADMQQRAAAIAPENLIEPKPSIVGPALQGLTFSHEEKNLKELYLGLLTSAMDARTATMLHPAFVEIIKQLDATEASLLRDVLTVSGRTIAVVRYKEISSDLGFKWRSGAIFDLRSRETGQPYIEPSLSTFIDNWQRLGLVEVTYLQQIADGENPYGWANDRPELTEIKTLTPKAIIENELGVILVTDFGRRFGRSVGMFDM